jgi:hypothetical protein
MVSIGGSPPVELSVLETFSVSEVAEVQLLRASSSVSRSAITSDGRIVAGDVILVRLLGNRRPPGP